LLATVCQHTFQLVEFCRLWLGTNNRIIVSCCVQMFNDSFCYIVGESGFKGCQEKASFDFGIFIIVDDSKLFYLLMAAKPF